MALFACLGCMTYLPSAKDLAVWRRWLGIYTVVFWEKRISYKSLVVGPAWVGDMVMAQALYKAINRHSNSAEIHVVAPAWSRPLLDRMPEITKVHDLDVKHGELGLQKRYQLGKSLKCELFDQALILPRSYKAALVPMFAQITKRVGELGEFRYGLVNHVLSSNKNKGLPTACNYLRYAEINADINQVKNEFAPALTVDSENQARVIDAFGISQASPLIACMVGAEYGPSKQWPKQHFVGLIDQLTAQGLEVCILGSQKDADIADEIETSCRQKVSNLCGKTSLLDVIDILASCSAAVSNDSGLMHIAAAVDVPVVAMYGATSPVYTPPLHPKAKSFYMKLECSPCWKRSCQYQHYRCLKDILPEQVGKAVLDRL